MATIQEELSILIQSPYSTKQKRTFQAIVFYVLSSYGDKGAEIILQIIDSHYLTYRRPYSDDSYWIKTIYKTLRSIHDIPTITLSSRVRKEIKHCSHWLKQLCAVSSPYVL